MRGNARGAAAGRTGRWLAALLVALPAAAAAADAAEGERLVARALEAMGGARAIAELRSLAVEAACTGPDGAFVTEVLSLRPDRTILRQRSARGAAEWRVIGERAFAVDPASGARRELPAEAREMVRGHEFHLLLFELDRRFSQPRLAGSRPPGEEECSLVELTDENGRPAAVCVDEAGGLPVWLTLGTSDPEAPPLRLEIERWDRVDGLLYLGAFTLRHGDEVFTYDYVSIRPNAVAAEAFTLAPERPRHGEPDPWRPGERITLSLKDADLAEVLRSFARLAGFNLVLDPGVRGAVTVELKDVPWEQALDVILRTHGLSAEVDGNVWRVEP